MWSHVGTLGFDSHIERGYPETMSPMNEAQEAGMDTGTNPPEGEKLGNRRIIFTVLKQKNSVENLKIFMLSLLFLGNGSV